MPRYFFHLRHGADVLLDPDGFELLDGNAAETCALRQIRDLLGQELRETGEMDLARRIDIANESGAPVSSVAFAQAVTIVPGGRQR